MEEYQNWGGDSSSVSSELSGEIDVVKIIDNYTSYAAIREDGSVVSWGFDWDGDFSNVTSQLSGEIDVIDIVGSTFAFAAIREDGSVETWAIKTGVEIVRVSHLNYQVR